MVSYRNILKSASAMYEYSCLQACRMSGLKENFARSLTSKLQQTYENVDI
jgi:hypothetical protein